MSDRNGEKPTSEQVFEIRYKPTARILDKRGTWAEQISEHMKLPSWKIGTNRLDVFEKDNEQRCFVGFGNSGYFVNDSPTANFFPDNAVKFFKFVLDLEDFPKPVFVTRLGVRQRFLTPFPGEFSELVRRYTERYVSLTNRADEAIRGQLIDIGAPLNFKDKYGIFNTNCGPMPKAQAEEIMGERDNLPEVGLYYDIDYSVRPEKEINDGDILKTLKTFASEGWDRHARIQQLIMGD